MIQLLLALLLALVAKGQELSITEAELRAYDGTDDSKPIYLAIDGTIFDVSASPAFYGPGGHYHHFTGRDATRAWVTECWDSEDQLTWRMDGLERMFMARYLDEELEKVKGGGELDLNLGGAIPREQIAMMAEKALERLGTVTDREKAERRKDDKEEATQKIHDTLEHWKGFFANNAKYKAVGNVMFDEAGTPSPPTLCEKALQKRPLKGGRLDSIMNVMDMGKRREGSDGADMPEFVKARLNQQQRSDGDDDDDLVKDEL
jgi:predicted heme/steroid binding protein